MASRSRLVYTTETPVYVSEHRVYGGNSFIWTTDKARAIRHARNGFSGCVSVVGRGTVVFSR